MAILSLHNIKDEDKAVAGIRACLIAKAKSHFPIPEGFVITTEVFNYVLERTGIDKRIKSLIRSIDPEYKEALQETANEIQKLIFTTGLPDDVTDAISEAYQNLNVDESKVLNEIFCEGTEPYVDIKPSTVSAEYEPMLLNYVQGTAHVIEAVVSCYAAHFIASSVEKRLKENIRDEGIAVIIHKSIDPEISGICFSRDNAVYIKAVYGILTNATGNFADIYLVEPGGIIRTNLQKQPYEIRKDLAGMQTQKNMLDEEKADKQKITEETLGELAHEMIHLLQAQGGRRLDFMLTDKLIITDCLPLDEETKSLASQFQPEEENEEGSIFSVYKQENAKTELTAARRMLGHAIIECELAVLERLRAAYLAQYGNETDLPIAELISLLEKKMSVPYSDEILRIKELRTRFTEKGKAPSISETKSAIESAERFLDEFSVG